MGVASKVAFVSLDLDKGPTGIYQNLLFGEKSKANCVLRHNYYSLVQVRRDLPEGHARLVLYVSHRVLDLRPALLYAGVEEELEEAAGPTVLR